MAKETRRVYYQVYRVTRDCPDSEITKGRHLYAREFDTLMEACRAGMQASADPISSNTGEYVFKVVQFTEVVQPVTYQRYGLEVD